MASAATEREVKLGVWPGFELPDLRGTLDGLAPGGQEEYRLEAAYFDTADLRLLRRGVTLRFRRGESPEEIWTAKLPEDGAAPGLTRREISVPGRASSMPLLLEDLVRGWALGAPLVPVARLRTLRHRTTLHTPAGRALAMIDDDEVSIVRRARVAARFRELELELADDAPDELLRTLSKRMRSAGAQPVDQMPKLVRALGPSALAPWDLEQPKQGPRPTAAELIRASLLASATRLVDHIAAVVLDEDVAGVHQARVGIRRFRSDLRTARPLLDAKVIESVGGELDWLMLSLGEVRDLDVLLEGLRRDIGSLDRTDRRGADAVLGQAREDRAAAYAALCSELRTARCAGLLEAMARLAKDPPFTARRANRPAEKVLPHLVRRPLRDLRRQVRKQDGEPSGDGLHRVRIKVKRARYAAELASPAAGKKARRAARGLADVQQVLGDHNDASVAGRRLRELGTRTSQDGAWAAGLLGGLQLAREAAYRDQFKSVWEDASAKPRWRWVK